MSNDVLEEPIRRFVPPVQTKAAILDEIAWLRSRLRTIGNDGDCAYERAMVKFYEGILNELLLRLRV